MEDRHAALQERTKGYASRVIRLYGYLQKSYHFDDAALILGKQLLRSATSAAATHREARHCRSAADRIAKFTLLLQELEESALWLELLQEHGLAHPEGLAQILDETEQLIAIFVASLHTLRNPSAPAG